MPYNSFFAQFSAPFFYAKNLRTKNYVYFARRFFTFKNLRKYLRKLGLFLRRKSRVIH